MHKDLPADQSYQNNISDYPLSWVFDTLDIQDGGYAFLKVLS